jgi:hypothetical protein
MLEKLGQLLSSAASVQSEFVSISNAVNALNRISKIIHENQADTITNNSQAQPLEGQTGISQQQPQDNPDFFSQSGLQQGFTFGSGVDIPPLNFLGSPADLLPDFSEGFHPMVYTRAIENEFAGRNWHESWWNGD